MNPQAHAKFDLEAEGKREAIRRALAGADALSAREIATETGIYWRMVHSLCVDLEAEGAIEADRSGQPNQYRLTVDHDDPTETSARELIEQASQHSHRTPTAYTDGGQR